MWRRFPARKFARLGFAVSLSFPVLLPISLLPGSGASRAATPIPACPVADSAEQVVDTSLYADGVVALDTSAGPDGPIVLRLYRQAWDCRSNDVDRFEFDGSAPHVVSTFRHRFAGRPHLFVVVSWQVSNRASGFDATLYQVYGYARSPSGGLKSDPDITSDNAMTGFDGLADGAPSNFEGKTQAGLTALLDRMR